MLHDKNRLMKTRTWNWIQFHKSIAADCQIPLKFLFDPATIVRMRGNHPQELITAEAAKPRTKRALIRSKADIDKYFSNSASEEYVEA